LKGCAKIAQPGVFLGFEKGFRPYNNQYYNEYSVIQSTESVHHHQLSFISMTIRHKSTNEERATVHGGLLKVALKLRNAVIYWVLKKDFGLITISIIKNILS
jgi:hypothetical protein